MRCSLKFLVPADPAGRRLLAVLAAAAQPFPNVGTPLSQEEIQSFDHIIGPEGKELPVGHGTAKEGAVIFAQALRGLPREEWRKRDHPPSGDRQSRQALSRTVLRCGKGRPELLPVSDDRVGLHQPRDAAPAIRDRSSRTKSTRWSRSCTIGTASSTKTTSWTRRRCRRCEMPNKNGFVPAKPVYPPDPKKPSWY